MTNAVNENGNGNGNSDKLSRLLQDLQDAQARLAAEKKRQAELEKAERVRQAIREKKETERLAGIIGRAILRELHALKDSVTGNEKEAEALETILKGILASESVAPMYSPSDEKLLRAKGWWLR